MEMDIAPGSIVYGDKAYTDYALEDNLAEVEAIKLIPDKRQTVRDSIHDAFATFKVFFES